MGKVAETKKKKKGRPSLLDLQKRTLKQQQLQNHHSVTSPNFKNPKSLSLNSNPNPNPNPNPTCRSTRRNPSIDGVSPEEVFIDGGDDEDERKEKKLKRLFGLPSHNHHPRSSANSLTLGWVPYGSDSNVDGKDPEAYNKKRKINAIDDGADHSTGEKEEKVLKVTDTLQGLRVESGPTTPLPDKKLLVFILDRLQKKDTYGVFSEPVDPDELPEYHDIIDHPMDFGTVRKKLDGGLYCYLEQFESDVFLICSNAMQYNSSDTIYFRQARSIQELAKKDFENLRQDSDDSEPQPKVVRRGRPPGKNLTKSSGRPPTERVGPEFSSDATLATAGDNAISSNSYNLRKGPTSYKFRPDDALVRAPHGSCNSETYGGWLSEWNDEFPASILKGVSMKYGKNQFSLDENRRDTYGHSSSSGFELSVLTTLEGEQKQLMAVGLHLLEHGYSSSLARFAADLGPIVWKIASKKIGSVLPIGFKFGCGWVGKTETLIHPDLNVFNSAFGSNISSEMGIARLAAPAGEYSLEEAFVPSQMHGMVINSGTSPIPLMRANCYDSNDPKLSESSSGIHSGNALALGSSLESHMAPEVGLCGKQSLQGFLPCHKQDFLSVPPDLNVRFQAPGSPTSSVWIGTPQQADLALQL